MAEWTEQPPVHLDETVDMAVSRLGFHHNRSTFLGMGHDWWVYHNHAKFLERPGVYLDLATNDPIARNNAFMLDNCLGWRGLCFEPNPRHHARIQKLRSCQLVPTCVSNRVDTMLFATGMNRSMGGNAKLMKTKFAQHGKEMHDTGILSLQCTTLAAALADANVNHVDFISLDLEGHELPAMLTLNFSTTTVDIIIAEDRTQYATSPAGPSGPRSVEELLVTRHGYRKLSNVIAPCASWRCQPHDDVFLRPGFTLGIERLGRDRIDHPRRCMHKGDHSGATANPEEGPLYSSH